MNTALAVFCVVAVIVVIFTEAVSDRRTQNRPDVCNLPPPKRPPRPVPYGYEIYYFDQGERKCKCFRHYVFSGDLGGNSFHSHKACRTKCKGATFSVCPRRGGKQ
ncbi:uncharacterized protein LOC120839561 [Ixodes scapularis]|uniref:uncharacterized protein LOC120839561 n=1 Tax=Ixodes scapularis TaxID=6945 RepID=UPI001A9E2602|nr:uncharacterized protein LOC120839561 [Ixodes scapularis]